ncbi:unnamed protein product [Caenorhabditis angaria]|uniref:TIL domain-containing protein n=1 Tax=Caenorhabditis angaria TaxID=860376 RepID=A0A9P1ICS8_9PELO|nr:unnamed protein product [Caenorhabditis angaria]
MIIIPNRIRIGSQIFLITILIILTTTTHLVNSNVIQFVDDTKTVDKCSGQCPEAYTCALVNDEPKCIYLPNCEMLECLEGEECVEEPTNCAMTPCIPTISCQPTSMLVDPDFQVSDLSYNAN